MNRRAFLATTAAAAAVSIKAASAASVAPLGQTGAPTTASPPLPLGPLSGARYPDARLESMKKPKVSFGPTGFPAFAGTMAVERVATGFRWAEGPVYFPAGRYVLFSDIPNNRIVRRVQLLAIVLVGDNSDRAVEFSPGDAPAGMFARDQPSLAIDRVAV